MFKILSPTAIPESQLLGELQTSSLMPETPFPRVDPMFSSLFINQIALLHDIDISLEDKDCPYLEATLLSSILFQILTG